MDEMEELVRPRCVKPGETTADGLITLQTVRCLGTCASGPVIMIDGKYYTKMTPKKARNAVLTVLRAEAVH